jgi:hypothetical protein
VGVVVPGFVESVVAAVVTGFAVSDTILGFVVSAVAVAVPATGCGASAVADDETEGLAPVLSSANTGLDIAPTQSNVTTTN